MGLHFMFPVGMSCFVDYRLFLCEPLIYCNKRLLTIAFGLYEDIEHESSCLNTKHWNLKGWRKVISTVIEVITLCKILAHF